MSPSKRWTLPDVLPFTAIDERARLGNSVMLCGLQCRECGTELRVPACICGICALSLAFDDEAEAA